MRTRTRWLLGLGLTLLLALGAAGYLAWRLAFPPVAPPAPEVTALDALELPTLSNDPKQARRELDQARKALAKLQPTGEYIVVDTNANLVSLRTRDQVILQGVCSTGSGAALTDSLTGQKWIFRTPHGVFKIGTKLKDPIWRKPDWAFVEEGERPPKDVNERYDENVMGEYAMGFGNGYFIHGTIYERLLGVSVTHGCVRLGTDDLRKFYARVQKGTSVYIF
ncbi:MAG: L,D-transpeptidase [Candidatus Krumholzibacteriia bacterium]